MTKADNAGMGRATLKIDDLRSVRLDDVALAERNIVGFDGRDQRSRPFNLMRTQLVKRLADNNVRLLGITSATPAAGKSFLSANLAASLSRVVKGTTILVDLDLRRGCVAEELGLEFEYGISDFLSSQTDDLSGIGMRIEGSTMAVFPTRASSMDSAQAIAGPRFAQLIEILRRQSDDTVIVFDLPPVFANDDAAMTVGMLDGYVIVVDNGKTSRRQLADAMQMLSPVPCLGTVLNRYTGGILDSYGYGSVSYDKYYSGNDRE